ncbi:MAG TPA: hypothetical protein VGF25_22150 [Thermoleophilaceae bacterium]|jgi:hypothetical protein
MKRLAGCIAVIAVGLFAAASYAATDVTRFQSDLQTKKPHKATSLKVGLTFADPADPSAPPDSLDHFTIALHDGTILDPQGSPTCSASDSELAAQAGNACPDTTQIGHGTAHAENDAGVEANADVTIDQLRDLRWMLTVYLAGTNLVVDHFFLTPNNHALVSGTMNVIAGGFHTQRVDLTFGPSTYQGHHLVTTPPRCPRRGYWSTRSSFTFKDGHTVLKRDRTPCRPSHRKRHRG